MKFILPEPQAPMDDCDELRVGNVYACKGGWTREATIEFKTAIANIKQHLGEV